MPDVKALGTGFGPPMPLTNENSAPEPKAAAILQKMIYQSQTTTINKKMHIQRIRQRVEEGEKGSKRKNERSRIKIENRKPDWGFCVL